MKSNQSVFVSNRSESAFALKWDILLNADWDLQRKALPETDRSYPNMAYRNMAIITAEEIDDSSSFCGTSPDQTPHLDQLATESKRLADFHCHRSVRSPTRAALLMGQDPRGCARTDNSVSAMNP